MSGDLLRRFSAMRMMGLETIVIVFVPSYLRYVHWIPAAVIDGAKSLFDSTDAIGIFIAVVIVGSIISIERRVLLAGLARISLPLLTGSIAAAAIGTWVSALCGLEPFDALLYLVLPIMSGGVSAGALPLSIGYAKLLGGSQGDVLAMILPAVIVGNLAAMLLAGLLGFYGPKRGARATSVAAERLVDVPADSEKRKCDIPGTVFAAAFMALLYGLGFAASWGLGLPAPLIILIFAAALQLSNVVPARLRAGILDVYRFCIRVFIYPLLFAVGLLLTPWERLIEGFALPRLAATAATVSALAVAGYITSRWVGLDPADGAMVTLTRAAMGGSGDIAVLSAGRRLQLMPFAQIATRIGGAATVAAALIAAQHLSP